jgi:hypothetical protein
MLTFSQWCYFYLHEGYSGAEIPLFVMWRRSKPVEALKTPQEIRMMGNKKRSISYRTVTHNSSISGILNARTAIN